MESFESHINSIQKKEKLYREESLDALDEKYDTTQDTLYRIENNIDHESDLITSNMEKIESNPEKDTKINEKSIERRLRSIENLLYEKEKLNKTIDEIKTAEEGIKIYTNNPFQQN
tara:strand:+ start:114 stop:461 length:348 start_codon:yes stop_codon:yes gene_type:complete